MLAVEPITILFAFLCGVGFRRVGFPPLPGYLLAGFLSHWMGLGDIALITAIADIGILLLLFTIGLKLNLKELAAPQVWGVASLQILIAVPLTAGVILIAGMAFPSLSLPNLSSAWVLAFALSFSSTVFAVKMFEDRGETVSLHATLAIGVLVIQDILAVAYLVAASDVRPGPEALVLLGLPLLRPIGLYLLRLAGHGELVLLFGITVALGAAQLFDVLHLRSADRGHAAGQLTSLERVIQQYDRTQGSISNRILPADWLLRLTVS